MAGWAAASWFANSFDRQGVSQQVRAQQQKMLVRARQQRARRGHDAGSGRWSSSKGLYQACTGKLTGVPAPSQPSSFTTPATAHPPVGLQLRVKSGKKLVNGIDGEPSLGPR